jgi:hypothetical protein
MRFGIGAAATRQYAQNTHRCGPSLCASERKLFAPGLPSSTPPPTAFASYGINDWMYVSMLGAVVRVAPASRTSSIFLRRIVGSMFMRVNAKCAHQARPPVRACGDSPALDPAP